MKKLETIKTYYKSNMGENVPEYSILGWESEKAQHLRFEILSNSVDLRRRKLLDVGCGTGNLAEFILNRNIDIKYTGIDILEDMISLAKRKNLKADFYCMDIFKSNPFFEGSFDVVYSSGIFNLDLGNNKSFLSSAVELFLNLANEAIVFNLLHFRSPSREDKYFYFDPDEVLKLLGTYSEKINKISIVEQYLKNDFTVVLLKNKS
ncbi:MAG: methyltransferase domain-containing protein [Bacillota bacterium]|nr:methyltransferase domain-containing protein [Bacillota bacterium]